MSDHVSSKVAQTPFRWKKVLQVSWSGGVVEKDRMPEIVRMAMMSK